MEKDRSHGDSTRYRTEMSRTINVYDVEGLFQSLATGDMFKQVIFRKPLADLYKEVRDIGNFSFDSNFNVVYGRRSTRWFMFDIEDAALI